MRAARSSSPWEAAMHSPSPNMPLSAAETGSAARSVSTARLAYWSLRRELWENRWLYFAPAAVGLVYLVAFVVRLGKIRDQLQGAGALDAMHRQQLLEEPYFLIAG